MARPRTMSPLPPARARSRVPLAAAAVAAVAALLVLPAPPARAAGLLVADGGLGGVLEIVDHDVAVTINNGVAVTSVTQVFRNTEERPLEALYTFPVPRGASVAELTLWIQGKEMVGEVVESRRAREIYESYKQRNVDPAILEQVDFRTFEMRVFPVPPRGEQRVRIVYYQELDVDRDWATYVYPLATSTRKGVDSRTQGRFSLTLTAASQVPIVNAESPSHPADFVVVSHGPNEVQASLEATGGALDRDLVVAYRVERETTGLDLVASKTASEDGYFQMTLTAGDELGKDRGGMDYVFVLDVSGSMADDGKLALSRGSLGSFVDTLGADDRFDVLAFNMAAKPAFGELRGASDDPKAAARRFLAEQRAAGGTVLEPALRAAYRYKDADRPLNVVILSDGMTEQRERATLLRLIGERPTSTRVYAVGVGNDVDRPLLERLANDAGGLAAFVSQGDDLGRQAEAFRRKLRRPAVTNLEIVAQGPTGDGIYDVEPRRLPSLHHGMPVRLYGRYKKAGPTKVLVRGDLGGERFEKTFDLALPASDEGNPEIERMWAWHRVRRLLDEADRDGSRAKVADEVVRLGEGYSIVTPYTSFLVLENDAEFSRWKIERRNATRIGRDRAAQERAREKLLALRTGDPRLGPFEGSSANASKKTLAQHRGPADARSTPFGRNVPEGVDGGDGGDGSRGGGAFDPVTVGLLLLVGGGAALARRRRAREAA